MAGRQRLVVLADVDDHDRILWRSATHHQHEFRFLWARVSSIQTRICRFTAYFQKKKSRMTVAEEAESIVHHCKPSL